MRLPTRLPHLHLIRVAPTTHKPRRLWSGPFLAILFGVVGTAAVLIGFALWQARTSEDRDELASTTVEAVDAVGEANDRLTSAGLPPVPVAPTLAASATSAASVVGTPAPSQVVTVTERPPSGRPTGFPVPGPTVTVTGPDGVVTVTSTETRVVVGPGGTSTITETRTSTAPAPAPETVTTTATETTTAPAPPPETLEVPGPVVTVTEPGPTVTVTEPGPTVTEAGPTVTVTAPAEGDSPAP